MCCTSRERDCCATPLDDFNPDQFLHQNAACSSGSRGNQVKSWFFYLERLISIKINRPIIQKKGDNYKPGRIPEVRVVFFKKPGSMDRPDVLRGLDHKHVPPLIPSVLYKPAAVL